jgi:hypothetical protein
VDLDRAHADPEIVTDQLVRPACQQPIKNLPLARTESCDSPDGVGDIMVATLGWLKVIGLKFAELSRRSSERRTASSSSRT